MRKGGAQAAGWRVQCPRLRDTGISLSPCNLRYPAIAKPKKLTQQADQSSCPEQRHVAGIVKLRLCVDPPSKP